MVPSFRAASITTLRPPTRQPGGSPVYPASGEELYMLIIAGSPLSNLNTTTRQRPFHVGVVVDGNVGVWEEGHQKLFEHGQTTR